MKTKLIASIVCTVSLYGATTFLAPTAHAMAGTDQVASHGKPVATVSNWPEGTMALVNDPLRSDGWNPWFSECANDVNYYEFNIRSTADVNHLLRKLAAIQSTNARLCLNPGKQATALAFTTRLPAEKRVALVLRIGNQKRLDEWYQRLSQDESGVRKFGVWRFTNAPVAEPPTLALYAGHEMVDLKQLQIPENIQVIGEVEHAEKGREETINAIEAFMADRKAKPANASVVEPAPLSYRDPASGMTFKVESDRHHVVAVDKDGKILWRRQPALDGNLPPYSKSHPRPNPAIVWIGALAEDQGEQRQKAFVGISFNSRQAGLLDKKTGDFTFQGQD